MRAFIIGTIFFACNAIANDETIFESTYNFNPHQLTKEETQHKSNELDKLWKEVANSPEKYLDILRKKLSNEGLSPFFYYDGSMLLLKHSNSAEDKKVVASALAKVDLRDVQNTEYLKSVHRLSVQGIDITNAALNALNYDEFQAFIPMHYLTLEQDFSFLYMLMPLPDSIYTEKLTHELKKKLSIKATNTLLLTIWYSSTSEGNLAIKEFIDNNSNHSESIKYAKELLSRNENVGPSFSISSVKSLKKERREIMARISDEALYELNSLTRKIIAKMN